jgi:CHAD domain-containing protein
MSFRLDIQQPVSAAVVSTIDAELEAAIASLSSTEPGKRPEAVHDARKRLKKARSALRLVRGGLRGRTARRLNAELRDIAGSLSEQRDADVLAQTVDDLHERFVGQVPATTFDALRDRLAAQVPAAATTDANRIARLTAVREALRSARFSRVTWPTVLDGIDRSYRRGRRAYRASAYASTQELHDWRKRAKDLWYHHRLLRDTHRTVVGAYAKDAHALSDLLGDDHDLAVLRATIVHHEPPAATAPVDLDPIVDLIDERRQELQAQARDIARRLYAEKPKAFRRRTRAYVRASARQRTPMSTSTTS